MAEDPEKILAMSDHQLMVWTLSGQEESYVHRIGETAMAMRASSLLPPPPPATELLRLANICQ
jgi:hypothetical protein